MGTAVQDGEPVPGEARQLVDRYQLETKGAPPTVLINVGAIELVERLPRLLGDGGVAVLTEYGSEHSTARLVTLPGHHEFSIHFGHLIRVAEQVGLTPTLDTLGAYLDFDGSFACLDLSSYRLLARWLLPFLGRADLPARAYDEAMLRQALGEDWQRLGNLRFEPLTDGGFLDPFSFHALTLRRRARPAAPRK